MRKLLLLLMLSMQSMLFAQQKISVSFTDVSVADAIQKIEAASSLTFYFDETWFKQAEPVSASFTNTDANTVLEAVFAQTNLNFYQDGNRVILTRNSVIYDDLPENYFNGKTDGKPVVSSDKPVFFKEGGSSGEETVALVGKEKSSAEKTATITGYVRDAVTGEAVPGVLLSVKGSNLDAVTDDRGFYALKVPSGQHTIEIKSLNYTQASRKVMAYSNGRLDFRVTENPNVLKEVIVHMNEKQNFRTAVTGVTNIDVENIKNIPLVLGERDIFRVATTLPGIKTTGEGSAGFNVRGGKEDQNLILLDDAVLYNPSHFLGFFSAVNPFTTGDVMIYKGSIPAEFGGRLSSVFDITTKKANTEKLSGEGNLGPVTSNLMLNIPVVKGKSGLVIGGRATYSGWILRSLKNSDLQNSRASFYDANLKYTHKLGENDDIELMGYYSHDDFSITSDSLYKYDNRLASVRWNHKFNNKHRGTLSLTNSQYKFDIEYDAGNSSSFDLGYTINETQAAFKFRYSLGEKHKINYGINSKLYQIEPGHIDPLGAESFIESLEIQREKGLESGAFISDDFEITEKWLVSVGVRYSSYLAMGASTVRTYQPGVPISDGSVTGEKTYGKNEVMKSFGGFEPRVSARYMIAEDFSVKAGFDQTYQYIHMLSSNTTQSPTATWKLSDLNVDPQMSRQFSLGFYKNLKDDMFEVSLEGYYKRSQNILDYKVGAQLLLNENVETELLQGEGKSYGVEFLIKKNSGRLNGWLGYTYSRTFLKLDSRFSDERVNNGEYFPSNFDKPHDFSAVLNYKFTKRYSFSANFIYQTGRPITYPIGSYMYNGMEFTLYSDRNEFRIPDYFRLDIGVNIEGNHKIKKLAHSFWNFSIYNVLGRNNPYSVFFVTEAGQVKAYKTSIFSIPVPTLTYNFKF
ncbi:TonB-dependent receptor [Flavobacterium selenitireducens]|uniref:TonB-dependent receptor n=1 Tax=Flavobacterium selenitireducens TaxID=2722704 RepID=UPI00168B27F4|nr:TonB-dependent receptor [Flavobacterium selenitireducens]MBD3583304.1 TonB-dependent receptor [Flavobacterium selenitireducens]